jgi:succinate dehydrogenase hydrophobic anchor subunit
VAFEDETIITQKPCIRKSLSFEGEQQKIEHTGSREKFSAYISMVWPEEKLMYNFYDEMNSTNTIDHLESLKSYTMKSGLWKRLILIWDHASFHVSKMMNNYIKTQKDWLTIIYLPKKAPYLLLWNARVLLDYIHARSTNGVLKIICYFLFQILGYYPVLCNCFM